MMVEILERTDGMTDELRQTIVAAAEAALRNCGHDGDITVAIVDNAEIHRMNLCYRDKDSATDVLSFPALEGFDMPGVPDKFLGDIAISLERAREQADEYGHSLIRELAFLTIHGSLHLMGYDHMTSEDEEEMFELQREILKEMRL